MEEAFDARPGPGPITLWTSILIGPLTWLTDLSLRYALVSWACQSGGRQPLLWPTTVVALILCAAGVLMAWKAGREIAEADDSAAVARARFMSFLGFWISLFSILAVLAAVVPNLILAPCSFS